MGYLLKLCILRPEYLVVFSDDWTFLGTDPCGKWSNEMVA
jgi:hypothetical protein